MDDHEVLAMIVSARRLPSLGWIFVAFTYALLIGCGEPVPLPAEPSPSPKPGPPLPKADVDNPTAPRPQFCPSQTLEPFAEAVCRLNSQTVELMDREKAVLVAKKTLIPYSCGCGGTEEGSIPYRNEMVSDPVVHLLEWPFADAPEPDAPALVRFHFEVAEAGEYFVFLKGDEYCCGCETAYFRIDAKPLEKTRGNWGIGQWRWESLRKKIVMISVQTPANSECSFEVPATFQLAAGKHTLDLVALQTQNEGLYVDEIVVARKLNATPDQRKEYNDLIEKAVWANNRPVAEILLSLGADRTILGRMLLEAIWTSPNLQSFDPLGRVDLLLSLGADPDTRSPEGKPVFEYAERVQGTKAAAQIAALLQRYRDAKAKTGKVTGLEPKKP